MAKDCLVPGCTSLNACLYNYVTKPCCFTFLFLIVQLLDVTARYTKISEEKFNFAKQFSAMEPVSIIFVGFKLAMWDQNFQKQIPRM